MQSHVPPPLRDLGTAELYRLIGEKWCDQLRPSAGSAVYLPSLEDIGRMHFRMLVPLIRFERQHHPEKSLLAATTAAVTHADWSVPATVVAALVARDGLDQ